MTISSGRLGGTETILVVDDATVILDVVWNYLEMPGLPIILMTGYTDLVSEQSVDVLGVRALMMKPLVGTNFLTKIRRPLDETKVDQ